MTRFGLMSASLWLAWFAACKDTSVVTPDSRIPDPSGIASKLIAKAPEPAMLVTSPPNDPRLFVVGQNGSIYIIKDGELSTTPFLAIGASAGGPVISGGERGLLGLAFPPDYIASNVFFVFYTTADANVVARYRRSASNPDLADAASGEIVLSIPDPFANHNGGMLEFGPDGYLYVGTGDGGSGGDPNNAGQDTQNLLGKILRLNVQTLPYTVPADNPFVAGGGKPEVFQYGLRNPWRWAFDRQTGDQYIADVGQNQWEEITIVPAGQGAGKNFGWRKYEGLFCFDAPCNAAGMTFPQVTYNHDDGWCSITGGDVYRGTTSPDLLGLYFYSDYCKHEVFALHYSEGIVQWIKPVAADFGTSHASIHAAAGGELYVTSTTGDIYQIVAN